MTTLPPKGMVSSHPLPATCFSGADLSPMQQLAFFFTKGFVFLQQAEMVQFITGAKKPPVEAKMERTGGACCWTGSAHLVSPAPRGSFTPSKLM